MLLHLFEIQDRNSAWTSLCLGQQRDESCDSRSSLASLRRRSSSPLYNAVLQPTSTAAYSHKHPELDTAACNDLSSDKKHPNIALHYSQPQTTYTAKTKYDQLPSFCRSELVAVTMPSGSQVTRSEPATRSNSIDCERDISKLPVVNKINQDIESPNLRLDLIVPNGK